MSAQTSKKSDLTFAIVFFLIFALGGWFLFTLGKEEYKLLQWTNAPVIDSLEALKKEEGNSLVVGTLSPDNVVTDIGSTIYYYWIKQASQTSKISSVWSLQVTKSRLEDIKVELKDGTVIAKTTGLKNPPGKMGDSFTKVEGFGPGDKVVLLARGLNSDGIVETFRTCGSEVEECKKKDKNNFTFFVAAVLSLIVSVFPLGVEIKKRIKPTVNS